MVGRFKYNNLISTMPLTELINLSGTEQFVETAKRDLLFSATHVVGLGLAGKPSAELANKCWIYFPEDDCPFYRATVFSNYSPNNVPDINKHWSLMLEVSELHHKPVAQVVNHAIEGALNTRLSGTGTTLYPFGTIERRTDIPCLASTATPRWKRLFPILNGTMCIRAGASDYGNMKLVTRTIPLCRASSLSSAS